ncbi:MAG TPA: hypothetical protein VM864_04615 [Pyrinomonadaceae bacterium]|jgi:hypothetical protein|nr:hypothetical protein [Pyrinomonadaceae bacterium]
MASRSFSAASSSRATRRGGSSAASERSVTARWRCSAPRRSRPTCNAPAWARASRQRSSNARDEGVREIALLTTTARDFFARKFGFAEAARADYEDRLAASPEWRLPRCSSAAFMRLGLDDSRDEPTP